MARSAGEGSLVWDEATGKWLAVADVTHIAPRPDGRRRRLKRSGSTQAEAKRRLDAAVAALVAEQQRRVAGIDVTVTELLDAWFDDFVAQDKTEETAANYRYSIDVLTPHLGPIAVRALTVDDVEAALRAIGGARSSLQKHRNRLREAITWGRKRDRFGLGPGFPNVAEDATLPKDRPKAPKNRRWLEVDERARLQWELRNCRESTLLQVIGRFGLRPAEGTGLRLEDLDLDHDLLHVRVSMKYHKHKPVGWGPVKTGPMGRGVRTLEIPPDLREVLVAHLANLDLERRPTWPRRWRQLAFPTSEGTPYRLDNLRRTLDRAARRAGLDGTVVPYDLRRAAAKEFVEAGMDIAAVGDVLGHENMRMAPEVYTGRRTRPLQVPTAQT